MSDLIQNIQLPHTTFAEQGSDAATPGSGLWRLYFKSGGLYAIDDGGTVVGPFATSAGAGALVKLAEIVLTGTAANFDFTSISGAYGHLKLIVQARGDTALAQTDIHLTLNNDTGSNYDVELLNGVNTTGSLSNVVAGAQNYIGNMPAASANANHAAALEITIFNYARTTFYKNYISHNGNIATAAADNLIRVGSGQWRSTSAVTRVTLTPGAGNFAAGSVATLYGLA